MGTYKYLLRIPVRFSYFAVLADSICCYTLFYTFEHQRIIVVQNDGYE